jgi:glutamate dehydrogenase (NAD(P)+)
MLSGRLLRKCAPRLLNLSSEVAPAASLAGSKALLHTSNPAGDRWQIPDRLSEIPTDLSPKFFNMVEYFFHKACVLAEDSLLIELANLRDMADEEKRIKVRERCTH